MTKPEILITAPMLPGLMQTLEREFTAYRLWEQPEQTAFLETAGVRIRGVATNAHFGRLDADLMRHTPNLEIVANFGVGYDNIDAAEAGRRGVIVTNTPGVLDDEVADLALGLTLATLRRIPQADRYLREGRWLKAPFPLTPSLRGRKVGIVGLGRIGQAIGRRFEAFGVSIAYHTRTRRDDIDYDYYPTPVELAAASDVLVIITSGGPATRHLVNAEVLQALGSEGVLINVARGSVVDEQALINALQSGALGGAGLDVFEDEPRVPQALIEMDNVVLLPHVGSASTHTRDAMGQLLADNLVAWFNGRGPLTPVAETPFAHVSAS
jgi:lactate dehydrogenase-like 2-hydroxyacid dehydrogenase